MKRKTYTPNELRELARQHGPQWADEVRAALNYCADLLEAAAAAIDAAKGNT
jgi:hypothetical protein